MRVYRFSVPLLMSSEMSNNATTTRSFVSHTRIVHKTDPDHIGQMHCRESEDLRLTIDLLKEC